MSLSEEYLKNVIRIVTETGLRIYRELAPMRKEQVDLVNKVAWIPASKTPNGVAEVPLTDMTTEAFRSQMKVAGPSPICFLAVATQADIKVATGISGR